MSKAFTKETDNDTDDDVEDAAPALPAGTKNYITPAGLRMLQEELRELKYVERPKIVEVVSWAAGNGDRSENGDYLYSKKRLREIDRRVRYLMKRLENAEVVDPRRQQGLERVFFGATVTYAREDGTEHTVMLVGLDETNLDGSRISWVSPVARALMKAKAGDSVQLRTPVGVEMLDVLSVAYFV